MLVMPSNNSKYLVHYWQGKYGGLAHLYSIGGQRGPYEHLPYALDNGRYPAFTNDKPWDEEAYFKLLDWARDAAIKPMWSLVPDMVGNPTGTLDEWVKWLPVIREYGFTPAFAAQDGHTPDDIPEEAEVVFIGGSTGWKRDNIKIFCDAFPRVHVGRINTHYWLRYCLESGAESCDGTGWFRGGPERYAGLEQYLVEIESNGQA
jgi:hypothetical protein